MDDELDAADTDHVTPGSTIAAYLVVAFVVAVLLLWCCFGWLGSSHANK